MDEQLAQMEMQMAKNINTKKLLNFTIFQVNEIKMTVQSFFSFIRLANIKMIMCNAGKVTTGYRQQFYTELW